MLIYDASTAYVKIAIFMYVQLILYAFCTEVFYKKTKSKIICIYKMMTFTYLTEVQKIVPRLEAALEHSLISC